MENYPHQAKFKVPALLLILTLGSDIIMVFV